MSPKNSALAYVDLSDEVSTIDREFIPTLSLIIPRRMQLHSDVSSSDLVTSIRGSITVSF